MMFFNQKNKENVRRTLICDQYKTLIWNASLKFSFFRCLSCSKRCGERKRNFGKMFGIYIVDNENNQYEVGVLLITEKVQNIVSSEKH